MIDEEEVDVAVVASFVVFRLVSFSTDLNTKTSYIYHRRASTFNPFFLRPSFFNLQLKRQPGLEGAISSLFLALSPFLTLLTFGVTEF